MYRGWLWAAGRAAVWWSGVHEVVSLWYMSRDPPHCWPRTGHAMPTCRPQLQRRCRWAQKLGRRCGARQPQLLPPSPRAPGCIRLCRRRSQPLPTAGR